jgi:D-Ala-D-Ala carboxypeptidase 3 (S13) family
MTRCPSPVPVAIAPGPARLIPCGLLAALIAALIGAGGASAQAPSQGQGQAAPYVRVTAPHHLYDAHRIGSRVVASVPVALGGEPVVMAVDGHGEGNSIAWLHVTYRGVRGWLPASGTAPASLPTLQPGEAGRLNALLDRAGPSAGGAVATLQGWSLWRRRDADAHPLASNAKLFTAAAALARFGSAIGGLLHRILPPSDNVLAQSLSDRLGDGSASLGAGRAVAFARRLGVAVSLVDGSGLSYSDRASAGAILRFLVALAAQPWFATLYDALPVTGRDGTLEFRMRNSVARGRCSAKTGSLTTTSNISGYCRTLSGHLLVFSVLMDHHSMDDARSLQDQMLSDLVRTG